MLRHGLCRYRGPGRSQIKKTRQGGRAGGERQTETGGFIASQMRRAGQRQVQVRRGKRRRAGKSSKEAKNNLATW